MNNTPIILDHIKVISLDPSNPPFNNYQAFEHNYIGLKILADAVRECELKVIADDPHAAHVVFSMSSRVPPIVPCAFNWFSVTIVNYLRLVALVDLMAKNQWKSDALADPANRQVIKNHCTDYVRDAIPEIYRWRNKVAAHFAATDPFKDDLLGTLEQSIMNSVTYKYPYYYVGIVQWNTQSTVAALPTWSLTNTYEQLCQRFWPDMKLRDIAPSETQQGTL
jgi:hypothetical protein